VTLPAGERELSRRWRAVQQQIWIEAQNLTLCRRDPTVLSD
jgi:hypothetical protein